MGPLEIRASVKPSSIDEEGRTVELVWSKGARVLRRSLWDGDFYEELSLDAKHVRLGRLVNGAPLLDSHNGYDSRGVIGVVESARVANGEGVATVRFARGDEDAEKVWRKVADGIMRNVSVGYRVYRYEKTEKEGELPTLRATDWEPYEISIVPMGADAGASVRAEGASSNPCEFVVDEPQDQRGAEDMPPEKRSDDTTENPKGEIAETRAAPDPAEEKRRIEDAKRAERERGIEIRRMCRSLGLGEDRADELVASDVSLDEARKRAIDAFSEERAKLPSEEIDGRQRVAVGEDLTRKGALEGVRNALSHRANPERHELVEVGRHYRGMSLVEIARSFHEAHGVRTGGMTKREVAQMALGLNTRAPGMHSTSDFPFILADVANKELRDNYDEAPQTFQAWCKRGTVPDFRDKNINQLGGYPTLDAVLEGGEYTFGSISEARETMNVSKYGRKIAFTWEMLLNDDLDAFTSLAGRIGWAVRDLESDLVYNHFLGAPVMWDTVALFHANHNNIGTGTISTASLGAGRAIMRKQTGLDGRTINVIPRVFLVPAALETLAEQNVSDVQAASVTDKNVFAGKLQVVAEPRLDADSAVQWYLAANPSQVETLRYAYLQGEEGPMVESRVGFDVDGLEVKVRHVFGVKAVDWRGLYRSSGA